MITNIIMIERCKDIYIYICNNDKILIYIKLDKF